MNCVVLDQGLPPAHRERPREAATEDWSYSWSETRPSTHATDFARPDDPVSSYGTVWGRRRHFADEITRLRSTAHLDEDDPDAEGRLYSAIIDAVVFAYSWPDSLPIPSVGAADDGEVVMEWRLGDRRAIAGFEGDKTYGYTLLIGGRFVPGLECATLDSESLPADLEKYLKG